MVFTVSTRHHPFCSQSWHYFLVFYRTRHYSKPKNLHRMLIRKSSPSKDNENSHLILTVSPKSSWEIWTIRFRDFAKQLIINDNKKSDITASFLENCGVHQTLLGRKHIHLPAQKTEIHHCHPGTQTIFSKLVNVAENSKIMSLATLYICSCHFHW